MEIHGGNIYKEAKYLGLSVDEILDFSANINPLGIPESIKRNISLNINNLVNYPDPNCTELKNDISNYLNIDEESIIIGNGASEIIYLFLRILNPKKVLIPVPSFSEYTNITKQLGIDIEYFNLNESDEFKLDINSLIKNISEDTEAILICNPNNPTSTLLSREEIEALIEYAGKKNIYVIIDEAFIELTMGSNNNSIVGYMNKYSNLFIIRAFTKIFAIPGLRLGYGIGERQAVKKMWDKKLPWSVNNFACSIGNVFLEEKEYLDRTCEWLIKEKEWIYEHLSKINDLKVFVPKTNFVLIKLLNPNVNSRILKEKMLKRNILIRDASNFVSLDERFIRIAVKDRDSNIRLVKALQEIGG